MSRCTERDSVMEESVDTSEWRVWTLVKAEATAVGVVRLTPRGPEFRCLVNDVVLWSQREVDAEGVNAVADEARASMEADGWHARARS